MDPLCDITAKKIVLQNENKTFLYKDQNVKHAKKPLKFVFKNKKCSNKKVARCKQVKVLASCDNSKR